MGKIIAIGGGNLLENEQINSEIVKLAKKSSPNLLLIPTASGESENEIAPLKEYFQNKFNCNIDTLKLKNVNLDLENLEKKILSADIIYVGGGNTLKMLNIWRKNKIDYILKKALDKGIILSGISAGAICWFKCGNSDSMKFNNKNNPLIKIKGLNFVPFMICPHYNSEKDRRPSLHKMILSSNETAIALDDCTAIEVIGDKFRVISERPSSKIYLVYKDKNNNVIEKEIPKNKKLVSLQILLKNNPLYF